MHGQDCFIRDLVDQRARKNKVMSKSPRQILIRVNGMMGLTKPQFLYAKSVNYHLISNWNKLRS